MYNPSAKLQKEFAHASSDHMPLQPLAGPLAAHLIFYFKRPKAHYGTGKNAHILKPGVPIVHTQKKDLDNLVKFVLDALNGQAYVDDGQIIEIHSLKLYTELEARTEVRLTPVEADSFYFAAVQKHALHARSEATAAAAAAAAAASTAQAKAKAKAKAKNATPKKMKKTTPTTPNAVAVEVPELSALVDGSFVIEHCKS
jgi:Holliday junction resolvase RusA-like endonuclease